MSDNGGLRYDEGKLRFDLIPPELLIELARVYTEGAKKYADRNWERGMSWSKCIACLDRHWIKWRAGLTYDNGPKGINTHHLANVIWNAAALMIYQIRGVGVDDRVKIPLTEGFDYEPRLSDTRPPTLDEVREFTPNGSTTSGLCQCGSQKWLYPGMQAPKCEAGCK